MENMVNLVQLKQEIEEGLLERFEVVKFFDKRNGIKSMEKVIEWFRGFELELMNEKECELMENEYIAPLGSRLYVTHSFIECSLVDKLRLVVTEFVSYYSRDYFGRKLKSTDRLRKDGLMVLDTFSLIGADEKLEDIKVSGWNEFKRNIYRSHIVEVENIEGIIELDDIIEFDLNCFKVVSITNYGFCMNKFEKHLVFDRNTGKYITKNMNVRKEYDNSVEVLRDLGRVGQ